MNVPDRTPEQQAGLDAAAAAVQRYVVFLLTTGPDVDPGHNAAHLRACRTAIRRAVVLTGWPRGVVLHHVFAAALPADLARDVAAAVRKRRG
ncbi:hypothetical protein [Nocardia carnea]|uniref:hypothetical protein n=1 Tax=Nocardia carnea TaxID=37328 RepID=UPI002453D82E|nr:hypothetical protein [Nocardia carnea]